MIQHINLKIFTEAGSEVDLEAVVPIFHQWIRESAVPEMLIDVADYRHVPAGPGVLLIGHEANYSIDNRNNSLGLLYNRKATLEGSFQDNLKQAHEAALNACDRLEKDGNLKFNRNSLEVSVNDRLLAPNNEDTWQKVRPELEQYFPGAKLERSGEPRDLFRVTVRRS